MAHYMEFVLLLSVITVGLCDGKCEYTVHEDPSPDNGTVCLKLDAEMTVQVKYDSVKHDSVTRQFSPICRILDSFCDSENITLQLSWNNTYSSDSPITTEFTFTGNNKQWQMTELQVMFDTSDNDTFPNAPLPRESLTFINSDSGDLIGKVDNKRSYYCASSRSIGLSDSATEADKNYTVSLKLSDFKVQAFKFSKDNKFDEAARCSKDIKGSKIVPIAVGAALAGLVIIVLIAYIIGRLRSRKQSSYEALS